MLSWAIYVLYINSWKVMQKFINWCKYTALPPANAPISSGKSSKCIKRTLSLRIERSSVPFITCHILSLTLAEASVWFLHNASSTVRPIKSSWVIGGSPKLPTLFLFLDSKLVRLWFMSRIWRQVGADCASESLLTQMTNFEGRHLELIKQNWTNEQTDFIKHEGPACLRLKQG